MTALLTLLGFVALLASAWRGIQRRYRACGWPMWSCHLFGAVGGCCVTVFALVFAVAPRVETGLGLCFCVVILGAMWRAAPNRKMKRPSLIELHRKLKSLIKGKQTDQSTHVGSRARTLKRKAVRVRAARSTGGSIIPLDDIQFSYIDYHGNFTTRRVRVHRIVDDYFEGFCVMRAALRTFRFVNVVGTITRMDTGEMLSVAEWLDDIRK